MFLLANPALVLGRNPGTRA